MLEKTSDMPDSVLGFRASGELTGEDYQAVLVPAVEAVPEESPAVALRAASADAGAFVTHRRTAI